MTYPGSPACFHIGMTTDSPLATHVVTTCAHRVVVAVCGELDISNTKEFHTWVSTAMSTHPRLPVDIDFGDVRFIDATIVRSLLYLKRAADGLGRMLVVSRLQPMTRRVLQVSGVYELLTLPRMGARRRSRTPTFGCLKR